MSTNIPTKSEELFTQALSFEKSGKFALALKTYRDIAVSDANYRPALLNLGSLCSRMGEHDEALFWFKKSSVLFEDYLVWFNIGSVEYKKGSFKDAVFALEKSRRLKPDFVLSILVMGLSYSKLGKRTAAAGCFAEVLTIDQKNQVALTALAIIHYDKKKYNLALHYAEAALSHNSKSLSARKLRSKILLSFGKTTESADEFKKIITEDKAFRRFDLFMRRVPKNSLEDGHGSIDDKIKIYENNIDKASPKDMVALSLLCLFKGESDKAIDYLFKAKD